MLSLAAVAECFAVNRTPNVFLDNQTWPVLNQGRAGLERSRMRRDPL